MRTHHTLIALGGLLGSAVTAALGCYHFVDDYYTPLTDPRLATGGTGGTSGSGGTGGSGGNPHCVGDPTTDPAIVRDECGVFVSATAMPGGDGTQQKPFTKLSDAVAKALAAGKRLYACDESYTEKATLKINGSLDVYGGFTGCESSGKAWTWSAAQRASLTGPADAIALVLASGKGAIHVENVDVTAPNATVMGGSSIAVYVNGGTAELVSSNISAGDAMAGADGIDAPTMAAQAGTDGNSGGDSCSVDTVPGAAQVQTTCGTAFSIGGKGGDGNQLNGASGQAGLPNNGAGQAGSGDDGTTMGWTCTGNMGTGKDGQPGTSGGEGPGASMMSFGMLDTKGFIGATGNDGMPGTPGQGGGGGGGLRGSAALCSGKPGSGGASGGSGGSGGCGGAPGGGGKGGGASVALVSANAAVTLTNVKLSAGNGGNGGRGGNLQAGGAPGKIGQGGKATVGGLQPGCNGGGGGKGGDGGPGGGGRGGHSIGITSTGTAPQIDPSAITIKSAGTGGKGGSNDFKGNHGDNGIAATCWDFGSNTACK
jgi:hypothetical protein